MKVRARDNQYSPGLQTWIGRFAMRTAQSAPDDAVEIRESSMKSVRFAPKFGVQKFKPLWLPVAGLIALVVGLSGCSSIDNPFERSSTPSPLTAQEPVTQGVPKIATIGTKGGSKIAVLVNKRPITTTAINRRMAFVRLRRMKGNARTVATNELIDESLQMSEARRLRVVAKDSEVDQAFGRFAKRNKLSPSQMGQVLAKRGVSAREFKSFIRAQISWQRAVGARLQRAGSAAPSKKRNHQPWLTEAGAEVREEKEFTLLQVVFSVPAAQRSRLLKARRREAVEFRRSFSGCGNARKQAANLREVAVRDQGRVRAAQLPLRWRKSVRATEPGQMTPVQETEKGVEILAVCRTRNIQTSEPDRTKIFEGGDLRATASAEGKKYMAELKSKAVIVRR